MSTHDTVFEYLTTSADAKVAYRTPAAFAAQLNAPGPRAALPDGSALGPVANPAPKGVSTAEALIAAG